MKKKSSGGGGANWMDTYGDMVTLLLCFFVLLYSMSTINEEKWRAVVLSFNPNAIESPTETPEGNNGPFADPFPIDNEIPNLSPEELEKAQAEVDKAMEDLYERLKEYVEGTDPPDKITIERVNGRVFVSFNDTIFFDGDSPVLRAESKPILENIAGMLDYASESIDQIRIMGHTAQARENKPNTIIGDRSLSAQRSANVLAYLQSQCIVDPAKMHSEGYGQWHPVAPNDTPENRAKNRRVEMLVSGRDIARELSGETRRYYE